MKVEIVVFMAILAASLAGRVISDRGLDLIKSFEGWRADAYWDAYGKVWTIGYGTTRYENGQPVRKGDRISLSRGLQLLRNDVNKRAGAVNNLLGGAAVNQNQFDALMSFAYNLGTGALGQSTLLTKVKRNRNDPSIRNEFMRFVYAGGQKLPGLVRRRKAEADLYFS